tara:strand:- start:1433 stop:2542 length:1110 start_codon:yes stop_codon:yes gene_type:complete
MKVLFILPTFSRKGAGVMEAPKGLALALNSHVNIDISAIALDDDRTSDCLKEWESINIYRRKNYFAGFSFGLSTLLDEIKPDIVHIHGLWVGIGIQSAFWAMKNKTPYIVSPHGMMDEWAWKKSLIKKAIVYKLWQKKVLLNAYKIHALNEEEAISIKKILSNSAIIIQPNGINLKDYIGGPTKKKSPKKLLYLGRLDPKKSVLELIKAWKSLIQDAKDFNWKLEIAGSGDLEYEKKLKSEAKAIPYKYITFKGHVSGENKIECFKSSDAFILPSKSEGLPVAILEAWASSLPVAMTKQCNLNEALELKLAFEVYPDIPKLEKSLSLFLSFDNSKFLRLGQESHQYVKKYYSWSNIAQEFNKLYSGMYN